MTQVIEFEGQRHEFPDDATQQDIAKALSEHTGQPQGYFANLKAMAGEAVNRMGRGGRQLAQGFSEWGQDLAAARAARGTGAAPSNKHDAGEGYGNAPLDVITGATNIGLGGLGVVGSPLNAAIDQYAGKPVESATGIPAGVTDMAIGFALPMKRLPTVTGRVAEAAPAPRMLVEGASGPNPGVILSEGQATRDLSAIQREQAALRGTSGPPAQQVAQRFVDQQQGQIADARERLARSMDPTGGARIAESPQEAGGLAQQAMQRAAEMRRQDVDRAYREARDLPGEIHADAFTDMSRNIRVNLSQRAEPVIIDDRLTPHASQMMRDIDERVSQLRIQNRASDTSAAVPAGEDTRIVGIDLRGVDQMRKRLSTMRQDAFASGNGADARAARAVLDSFDERIDAAVNGGMFRGDPRAIGAWNAARAAHADYRATFSGQGGRDRVGNVVQKILGDRTNPAAIPNDVADFMYGSAGVNPASLNVQVVNRIRGILGEQSPEWIGVKQGLFSRLVDAGEGATAMGPGKVAQRLNRFLNSDGREMAGLVFSADERAALQQYANLMRHLEIPQAGANWSNTATFSRAAGAGQASLTARALQSIGSRVGMAVGAVLGNATGLGLVGEAAGAGIARVAGISGEAMTARQIARQMPIIGNVVRQFRVSARAAETSPNARNIARLTLASRNLSTNLASVGVAMSPDDILRGMQGPSPTPAQAGDNKQ